VYLSIILLIYLFITCFEYWLDYLNLQNLRKYGSVIPAEFEGEIDQDLLSRTQNYNIEKMRFGFVSSAFHTIILVFFLFGGILDLYSSWVVSLNLPFILSGLIFFIILLYAETLISIPFNLYSVFRIENRYGFNTMTSGLWIKDSIKSMLISTVLTGLVICAGLFLIEKSPNLWWFWIWCLFISSSVFMMYISPYVIEPLFNRFDEVEDPELKKRIIRVAEAAGIRVERVLKVDASRRTSHTNAYFTGIGHVKRIVLYDTLLEKLDNDEIASVLAHEAGHWRKRHLQKALAAFGLISLAALYLSYRVIESGILGQAFAFEGASFYALVALLGFLLPVISFPFKPLLAYLSRRHEREADRYALELTENPSAMAGALVKLSKDNLSNLFPHPLYAAFHYTHPPMAERVGELIGKKRMPDS